MRITFFFFFQAEDGIRDIGVTGVQTCALPISLRQALVLSFATSGVTLLLAVTLGTPLAYRLARRAFRGRRLVDTLVDLPIVLPPAVAGIALLAAFGRRGVFGNLLGDIGISLPFTTPAVVLAQLFVAVPFYV